MVVLPEFPAMSEALMLSVFVTHRLNGTITLKVPLALAVVPTLDPEPPDTLTDANGSVVPVSVRFEEDVGL